MENNKLNFDSNIREFLLRFDLIDDGGASRMTADELCAWAANASFDTATIAQRVKAALASREIRQLRESDPQAAKSAPAAPSQSSSARCVQLSQPKVVAVVDRLHEAIERLRSTYKFVIRLGSLKNGFLAELAAQMDAGEVDDDRRKVILAEKIENCPAWLIGVKLFRPVDTTVSVALILSDDAIVDQDVNIVVDVAAADGQRRSVTLNAAKGSVIDEFGEFVSAPWDDMVAGVRCEPPPRPNPVIVSTVKAAGGSTSKSPRAEHLNSILAAGEPFLGEISYAAIRDFDEWLINLGKRDAHDLSDEEIAALPALYDQHFDNDRYPDYRYWRASEGAPWYPHLGYAHNLIELAKAAIQHPSPMRALGGLAVAARTIGPLRDRNSIVAARLAAIAVDRVLNHPLSPMPEVKCARGSIEALVLQYAWMARSHLVKDAQETARYLEQLQARIRILNATWAPGRVLNTDAIEPDPEDAAAPGGVPRDSRRAAVFNKFRCNFYFAYLFYEVTDWIGLVVSNCGYEAAQKAGLTDAAYLFACSNYDTLRSLIIAEKRAMQKRPGHKSFIRMQKLHDLELGGLKRAREWASASGRDFSAAMISARLVWYPTPELSKQCYYNPDPFAGLPKQVGLAIPEKYLVEEPHDPGRTSRVKNSAFLDRLRWEQKHDCHWQDFWQYASADFDKDDPIGSLNTFRRNCTEKTPVYARLSAFSLLLHYGRLKDAISLIEDTKLQLPQRELAHLVHMLGICRRLNPYLLNLRQHAEWQNFVRSQWAGLQEPLDAKSTLSVHEALLGVCTTFLGTHRAADTMARRLYGEHDDDVVSEQLLRLRGALDIGSKRADFDAVITAADRAVASRLGRPLLASVVDRGSDWSLLTVDTINGGAVHQLAISADVRAEADIVASSLRHDLNIVWKNRKGLIALGEALAEQLRRNPACRWLVLATEPELGKIPWQLLLREVDRELADQVIISLVPSISWFVNRMDSAHRDERGGRQVLSTMAKLMERFNGVEPVERAKLEAQFAQLVEACQSAPPEATVVMGHGKWVAADLFVSVVAPTEPIALFAKDQGLGWNVLGRQRLIFVHGCWGGMSEKHFLGDLAGPAGLAVGFDCRCFCGPVAPIKPRVATHFQQAINHANPDSSVGDIYLKAFREQPLVGIYNVVGLASESISTATIP